MISVNAKTPPSFESKIRTMGWLFMMVGGLAGALGLILQAWITYGLCFAQGMSVAAATSKYLSYFTLLTNLLVVISFAVGIFAPDSIAASFFARSSVRSGALLYIELVGVVYITLLAHLWQPTGAQWLADFFLHSVTPVLYALYWVFFAAKEHLEWKLVLKWLAYPLCYVAWILLRGIFAKDYPHPFIDAHVLSVAQLVGNSALFLAAFTLAGVVVISLNRWAAKKQTS